eukprot:1162694-Pleurochrysis_carterae.AAC.5
MSALLVGALCWAYHDPRSERAMLSKPRVQQHFLNTRSFGRLLREQAAPRTNRHTNTYVPAPQARALGAWNMIRILPSEQVHSHAMTLGNETDLDIMNDEE